jgi:uncharacterized oligopeptide transporter (OPT) family protein
MAWLAAVSVLGVFMAVPLKRQLINHDQLPFPTGTATAETLRSMHTTGAEAMQKALVLLVGGVVGAVVAFAGKGLAVIWKLAGWTSTVPGAPANAPWHLPHEFPFFPADWARNLLQRQTLGFEGSLIMLAAGAIMGIRVGISLLVGAVVYFGIIGQVLVERGIVQPGYRGIVSWTLWPATAMMVTAGMLSFAFRWRTIARSFRSLAAIFGGSSGRDPLQHVEVPGSWFVVGTGLSGLACIVLAMWFFGIAWWMGLLAVLVTFLLSIVAARATGETDITPIGAMGKITQLIYGVLAPSNVTTNLMTASITAGAASHSADLLTDLKSGYLLGGNPRYQTISQLFGVIAGTLFCVPVYMLVVTPESLGSAELPAPAAQVWKGVAELLAKGIDQLPPGAAWAMAIGGLLGIVLAVLEEFVPRRHQWWMPSATGLGIAGVVPAYNSISMFLGALAAWILSRTSPAINERFTVAASSGVIAGESLMGVTLTLCDQGPDLVRRLF